MNGTGEGIATDQISSFLFHQFDALERDAYKVLQSIRSWRNRSAPINRIPPEILSLIPHFWKSPYSRDQDVITLTHVCQAWRDVFVPVHLCGPISAAGTSTKLASTSNGQDPPPSTCHYAATTRLSPIPSSSSSLTLLDDSNL